MSKYVLFILGFSFLMSCAKEYSFESPLPQGALVTVGNNCVPSKVIDFDTIANKNVNTKQTAWHSTGNYPTAVFEMDSLTNQTIFSKSLTLTGDTLRIDALQYFLLDVSNNYRVREFVGYENPYNTNSQRLIYRYLYNVNNYLIAKTVQNFGQQGVILTQTNYSYNAAGTDLISVKTKIPTNNVVFYEAEITYNVSKSPTNFLYLFTDSKELSPYMQVLNFGKRPLHEPTKIVTKNYNQLTSTLLSTNIAELLRYTYSADNYVLSVDYFGHNIQSLNLANSRNKFQYFCK